MGDEPWRTTWLSYLTKSVIIDIWQGLTKYRSSPPEMLCKKDVLENFAKFTGKHLFRYFSFNKVAGLRPPTLFKKRL